MKTCPVCKKECADTAQFCDKCGYKFSIVYEVDFDENALEQYEPKIKNNKQTRNIQKRSDKSKEDIMKYCTKCGAQNIDEAQFCTKCGAPLVQKITQMPVVESEPQKETSKVKIIIIAVIVIVVLAIFGMGKAISNISDDENTTTEITTVALSEEFEYELSEDNILLERYIGKEEKITIQSTYEIDGKTYKTDIYDFQISNGHVKSVVFAEGITDIKTAIFNGSSSINSVYFPSSMEIVYDTSLSYLHPDENSKIDIYYAGSEEEWNDIFKEYKPSDPKEEFENGNYEEAGAAAAHRLNEKIGATYNSENFEFHFN